MDIHEKELTTAKTLLVRTFPFMAFIVISTKYIFVEKDDPIIKTMAATVIGNVPTVLINPTFMMDTLGCSKERAFVVAHELLHIFYHHLGRQRIHSYNPKLWNVAADYFINSLLISLKSPNLAFPSLGLYDEKYMGMSSDEVYHLIVEENDGDAEKALSEFGDVGDGDGGGGGGGGKGQPFDEISTEDMTSDEKAILKATLSSSLNGGNMSGDMRNSALVRSLYNIIAPAVHWRDELADIVVQSRDERYTYNRYNPRSTGQVIFPASTGESINLVFGIDTSGSMSDSDLAEALTELKEIVDVFSTWKINLVTCEMEVTEVGEYSSEIGDDFSSFSQEFNRGGGTDMNPIVEYAESQLDDPSVIIILTDGYLSEEIVHSHIPVIIVVTRNGNADLESSHRIIHIADK